MRIKWAREHIRDANALLINVGLGNNNIKKTFGQLFNLLNKLERDLPQDIVVGITLKYHRQESQHIGNTK